jgi:hypothetical protein
LTGLYSSLNPDCRVLHTEISLGTTTLTGGADVTLIRNVLVAVAVLIAGVAGLLLPVAVFDGGSSTVGCGNALAADASQARAANVTPAGIVPAVDQAVPRPNFVLACDEAISGRRHWAIPLVIVGLVGLVVGIVFRGRRGAVPGGV